MPTQSFLRILELLDEHGVEFIVVGGVAAVLHGAPVTTFDIDTLIKLDGDNADKLLAALTALDARYREHVGPVRPTKEDVMAGGRLLSMTNAGPLDVLGFIGRNRRYDDVADKTSNVRIGRLPIRVLNLETLIEEKRALGRDKDLAVARLLEAV